MSDLTRAEMEAKFEASEAKTDAKFARIEGKIDVIATMLSGKLDSLGEKISAADSYNRDTRWVILGTVVTSAIAICAIIIGIVTYGDAIFGRGMSVRDVVQTVVKEQQELSQRPQHPGNH